MMSKSFLAAITLAFMAIPAVYSQERAAAARAITGGVSVTVPLGYESAYEDVIQLLKKKDYTIESADKDIGQITTAVSGSEGWKGTRSWVQVNLTKDDATHTALKVAVANQNRSHTILANRGEYHSPKLNTEESQKLADELKATLTPGQQ